MSGAFGKTKREVLGYREGGGALETEKVGGATLNQEEIGGSREELLNVSSKNRIS